MPETTNAEDESGFMGLTVVPARSLEGENEPSERGDDKDPQAVVRSSAGPPGSESETLVFAVAQELSLESTFWRFFAKSPGPLKLKMVI